MDKQAGTASSILNLIKKLKPGTVATLGSGLGKVLRNSKRIPYKQRKDILSKPVKGLFKEPKHYSASVSGKAARLKRETQYRTKPEAPFFAGLLMPKNMKTKWNRTIRNIDEKLGESVVKMKGGKPVKRKGMFIEKEYVRMPGTNKYVKHYYPSISAPIKKTSAFVTPMLASMYVMDAMSKKKKVPTQVSVPKVYYHPQYGYLEKRGNAEEEFMTSKDRVLVLKKDLEKTAAALRQVKKHKERTHELEKTAEIAKRAQQLAFSLVEKGRIPPFKNYEEFQEKVASLRDQDLDVVEKALEFDTGSLNLGEVGNNAKGGNALEQFVLED